MCKTYFIFNLVLKYYVVAEILCFVSSNRFETALCGTALRGGFALYTTYITDDDLPALYFYELESDKTMIVVL